MSNYNLSIVVVTRNDNHGLNLNERTNRFIDSCSYMSLKHKVFIELIIVEWNPPKTNDSLDKLISGMLPNNNQYLTTRIITVPQKVHKQFKNSRNLHLFQMIGKNVGVRRAKGEFILATNIDIIFSDEIFINIKKGLKKNTLYRSIRVDVPEDFAFIQNSELLLKSCMKSFHTINYRFGTYVINNNSIMRKFNFLPFYFCINFYLIAFIFNRLYKSIFNLFSKYKFKKISIIKLKNFFFPKKKSGSVFLKIHILNCYLFCNACGDFTLMDKKSWLKVNGYVEWPIYSIHIDSLLLYQAYYQKIRIKNFSNAAIFHIDHAIGSGYSIDGEKILFSNLKKRSIPFISYKKYNASVEKIKNNKLFLRKNWGLKLNEFKEKLL